MSSESEFDNPELQSRFEELCDEFLNRLRSGEDLDRATMIQDHPELAPKLESRLRLLEALYSAQLREEDEAEVVENGSLHDPLVASLTGQLVRRVNCPNCGNGLQIVEPAFDEVTCESCGSAVDVSGGKTKTAALVRKPEKIGRFQIRRTLGQGTFGVVFLGYDPKLDRKVALKVPRQGYFLSDQEEQRFMREAQSAARLHHENIVRVHEVSTHGETPFIVSEFIEGVTLTDLCNTQTLSCRDIVEIMIKICNAVAHAHENGILHRDLKPSNILIDQSRKPFVTDFGLARAADSDITMTVEGMILGTPAYMSPEQATGQRQNVDFRSDVFSLGVTLYKLLCNELPFTGSARMMLMQMFNEEPVRPSRYKRGIPRDLETITLKAMAKEKHRRFPSVASMGQELQRWLDGKPIHSRPIGRGVRIIRWCRRHPKDATIVAMLVTFLLTFAVFFLWKSLHDSELRRSAEANAAAAIDSQKQSEKRLHEIYEQNGFNALNANQLVASAYWFSRALELVDDPKTRFRCGQIIDQMPKLAGVFPVGETVLRIEFSRSGERVALGTESGEILVYDIVENKLLVNLSNEGVPVYRLEFLKEGAQIAFRSNKSSVKIWDIDRNVVVDEIYVESVISSLESTPSGSQLVIGELNETVKYWDADQRKMIRETKYAGEQLRGLKYARADRLLVMTWHRDRNQILLRLIDPVLDKEIALLEFGTTVKLDISLDQTKFLTVESRSQMRVWRLSDGAEEGSPIESNEGISDARFSSDSQSVMGLIDNHNYVRWNIGTGVQEKKRIFFKEIPKVIALNDSRTLLSVGNNSGDVQVYHLDRCVEVANRLDRLAEKASIIFRPKTDQIAIDCRDGIVRLWDLSATQPDHVRMVHAGEVRDGFTIANSNRCITASMDGKAYLWNLELGKIIKHLQHEGPVLETLLSPDHSLIATISSDNTARLWSSESGGALSPPLVHPSSVVAAAFDALGEKLITGCIDGTIRVWPTKLVDAAQEPKPLFEVKHGAEIRKIKLLSDGKRFATAGFDGFVRLWNLENGNPIGKPIQHPNVVLDIAFVADDQVLVTSGSNWDVRSWELPNTQPTQTFKLGGEIPHLFHQANDNDDLLIASGRAGVAYQMLYGHEKLKVIRRFRHPLLSDIAFSQISPDGEVVGSAGGVLSADGSDRKNGAVVLWSMDDGRPLGPPWIHGSYVRRVRFSSEGTAFLSASQDGVAKLCRLQRFGGRVDELRQIMDIYYPNMLLEGNERSDSRGAIETYRVAKSSYPSLFEVESKERENWGAFLE